MEARGDAGFTLVEMLITLAILGVVFGLLASTVGLGRDVLDKVEQGGARMDELVLCRRVLTESLSQVVGKVGFAGTSDAITMLAYAPQALGRDVPVKTAYGPDSAGRGLQVSWNEAGKDTVRRTLTKVFIFNFLYFDPRQGWVPRWDAPDALPSLVRVGIRQGADLAAGEFTIAVRQLRPPSCLVTPSQCVAGP